MRQEVRSSTIGAIGAIAGTAISAYELLRYLQFELPWKELALGISTALVAVLAGVFSVYVANSIKRLRIKPRVFLSYSNNDRKAAGQVADALRSAGAVVWFDEEQLKPNQEIKATIEKAIKEANSFVVLLPHEPGPNVFFEIGLAQANNVPVIAAFPEGARIPSKSSSFVEIPFHVDEPISMKNLVEAAIHPNIQSPANAEKAH